ncbi:uncharacterized protein FIBRA_01295 [Fibroporia radiculosa]|uniref:Epoxide hydrolase N-terminal domain-containing protein n=1 Tax=Fibroporia radiculosa TaxID=599839 RepID=J4GJT1_9APHY|nr:uncharacterized protein FIBRA_01295 [Fibroporia radiculosa]CCL99280.1 predicted protein [Fibroporia radiculosa]
MSESPFTLAVPDTELEFLRKKLELTRFPDELDGAEWKYGPPLEDMRRLVARWKDGYDWRKAEAEINKIPQFTRDIEVDGFGSLNIHYVHQQSRVTGAVPLLFIHGWPGHFMEVSKLLPLLPETSPEHPSFHVVALSLPGFGFSEAAKKTGFGIYQYAEVANKLMVALGYHEYVIQAGDWGYGITKIMAHKYGHKYVKAWHTNFPTTGPPTFTSDPGRYLASLVSPYTAEENASLERTKYFWEKRSGYFRIQQHTPQTLGYSIADSPAGLLGWIYEKIILASDSYPWDDDEILTWISIYWFSRAGPTASVRIYYEATTEIDPFHENIWSSIPLGFSFFPKEIAKVPRLWSRGIGNVVFEAEHESGGHFAAHEKPAELVGDLRKMFGKGGPAYGVVKGKDGYA